MGVGLTITKMILQQLDGKIEVESEKDKGAKFTFFIPIDDFQGQQGLNEDCQQFNMGSDDDVKSRYSDE